MAKIHITTNDGVLFETINTSGYDFSKSFARQHLLDEILGWLEVIEKAGHDDGVDFEQKLREQAQSEENDI